MGLTVDLKPAGLRPVGGGDLFYQWTESSLSGKPNYRVELSFNGLGLPLFEFRPDEDGVIRANIAPILRSVLALSMDVADRFKNTYVSYQAVWDGGSDSQVDLTGDVIYFYVGINHYLNNRSVFGLSLAAGVDGPPEATFPDGPALKHEYPTKETDRCVTPTPNLGMIGWVGREFVFEFLNEVLSDSTATCGVLYEDGTTITNLVFDGTVRGLHQLTFTPSAAGQYSLFVLDGDAGKVLYRRRITVYEDCEDGIYLQWINDYGGLERYLFEDNHEQSLVPGETAKGFFRTLYAKELSYEKWLALSEMFRGGQVYNDERRIGQLVQDITDYDPEDSGEANIIDVIVTPDRTATETRQKRRDVLAINVRYPLLPNSGVA